MTRLVEQLLNVARLDALPLDVGQPCDLCRIVSQVVEQLVPWAFGLGRSIAYEPPPGSVMILGHGDALASAVRNLVENAVRHTPVGTEVIATVSRTAEIRVTDRGTGIERKDRERVFSRFWRGSALAHTGAGLGLAIVAEVTKAHRGAVSIEETEHGGACFLMDLSARAVGSERPK